MEAVGLTLDEVASLSKKAARELQEEEDGTWSEYPRGREKIDVRLGPPCKSLNLAGQGVMEVSLIGDAGNANPRKLEGDEPGVLQYTTQSERWKVNADFPEVPARLFGRKQVESSAGGQVSEVGEHHDVGSSCHINVCFEESPFRARMRLSLSLSW